MWLIIFTTSVLYVLGVGCRPAGPLEGPLWNDEEIAADLEKYENFNKELLKQQEQQRYHNTREDSSYNTGGATNNNVAEDEDDYELLMPVMGVNRLQPNEGKRGLTMFARWGQFNNIGKQRTPIRSNYIEPFDTKSTRGRISGQPLRWG